jgi:hypothetical protein
LQLSKRTVKELKAAADRKAKLPVPDLAALKKQYLERLPQTSPFRRAGLCPAIPDPIEDYSATPARKQRCPPSPDLAPPSAWLSTLSRVRVHTFGLNSWLTALPGRP